mmetsp:Transcript_2461/g.8359  ORF Transcript_2461/g.8359 Transcript_2461/m.8359 type:complete len:376 (-) Transcript_2461:313-1440(-)
MRCHISGSSTLSSVTSSAQLTTSVPLASGHDRRPIHGSIRLFTTACTSAPTSYPDDAQYTRADIHQLPSAWQQFTCAPMADVTLRSAMAASRIQPARLELKRSRQKTHTAARHTAPRHCTSAMTSARPSSLGSAMRLAASAHASPTTTRSSMCLSQTKLSRSSSVRCTSNGASCAGSRKRSEREWYFCASSRARETCASPSDPPADEYMPPRERSSLLTPRICNILNLENVCAAASRRARLWRPTMTRRLRPFWRAASTEPTTRPPSASTLDAGTAVPPTRLRLRLLSAGSGSAIASSSDSRVIPSRLAFMLPALALPLPAAALPAGAGATDIARWVEREPLFDSAPMSGNCPLAPPPTAAAASSPERHGGVTVS